MSDLLEERGALFSEGRTHRFRLWIRWNHALPMFMFIGINPSTADEIRNDPTVERMERRARTTGYGGLYVGNVFAFRSTKPGGILTVDDPVGEGNDDHICRMAQDSAMVLCGWGKPASHMGRGVAVEKMLRSLVTVAHKLHALEINADGSPRHPLYVSYTTKPRSWNP